MNNLSKEEDKEEEKQLNFSKEIVAGLEFNFSEFIQCKDY